MILSVKANQPSFKSVQFTDGLNVIVADQAKGSSSKESRNGVGKTTLFHVINFCLGADHKKGTPFHGITKLADWIFSVSLLVEGNAIEVSRSISDPKSVEIKGEVPHFRQGNGDSTVRVPLDEWKDFLGSYYFNIENKQQRPKGAPSFRTLCGYTIRTGIDAYVDPFKAYGGQKANDVSSHIALLLGLDWTLSLRWQEIADKNAAINSLDKAIQSAAQQGVIGALGDLVSERVKLESEIEKLENGIESFAVHEQYEQIQESADLKTKRIQSVSRKISKWSRRLTSLLNASNDEGSVRSDAISAIYGSVGAVFTDGATRTLEEAEHFFRKITANRKKFLNSEVSRTKAEVKALRRELTALEASRSNDMRILKSHGALEEFVELQKRVGEKREALARITSLEKQTRDRNERKRELRDLKAELRDVASRDFDDREESWSEAMRLFNQATGHLYNEPGKLVVDVTANGYRFKADAERKASDGVTKMCVFAFDIVVFELLSRRIGVPRFLAHDSTLFADVDERQKAHAIQYAAEKASSCGSQYIMTINSDHVPTQHFEDEFDFESYIRLRLTDESVETSLLGVLFEKEPG